MPKIFVEEKPVDISADYYDHLFLVYQGDDGSERVIRGGPQYDFPTGTDWLGNIKIAADANILDTRDSPFDASGNFINRPRAELDLQGRNPDEVWANMRNQANAIGGEEIPYSAYVDPQNSNSVVASTLNATGFDIATNLPPGIDLGDVPGVGNLLQMYDTNYSNLTPFADPGSINAQFAQGLFPQPGWDQMPSLDLPDVNAGGPFAVDAAPLGQLPSLDIISSPMRAQRIYSTMVFYPTTGVGFKDAR